MNKQDIYPIDFTKYRYYAKLKKYWDSMSIKRNVIKLISTELIEQYINNDKYYLIREDIEWADMCEKMSEMNEPFDVKVYCGPLMMEELKNYYNLLNQ